MVNAQTNPKQTLKTLFHLRKMRNVCKQMHLNGWLRRMPVVTRLATKEMFIRDIVMLWTSLLKNIDGSDVSEDAHW